MLLLQVRGKKILILDRKVSGFLGLIAEVPLLKEHGVERYTSVQYLTPEAAFLPVLLAPCKYDCASLLAFAGYCTYQKSPFRALM